MPRDSITYHRHSRQTESSSKQYKALQISLTLFFIPTVGPKFNAFSRTPKNQSVISLAKKSKRFK